MISAGPSQAAQELTRQEWGREHRRVVRETAARRVVQERAVVDRFRAALVQAQQRQREEEQMSEQEQAVRTDVELDAAVARALTQMGGTERRSAAQQEQTGMVLDPAVARALTQMGGAA